MKPERMDCSDHEIAIRLPYKGYMADSEYAHFERFCARCCGHLPASGECFQDFYRIIYHSNIDYCIIMLSRQQIWDSKPDQGFY